MNKYLEVLENLGVANGFVISFALFVSIVPLFWKLRRDALLLRRSSWKENLEKFFQVLDGWREDIPVYSLRVELTFRELFGVQLNIVEINFLVETDSPLSSITDYKYGYRYLKFEKKSGLPVLIRSRRRLWWQDKCSTFFFICSMFMLLASLLFMVASFSESAPIDVIMIGALVVVSSLTVAWFCLEQLGAVNAAVRATGGWKAESEVKTAQINSD
ncbi:hypothetical protein JNO04_10765 [Halomonas sp. MC140]|nr:hypothetical protein [Halomonas sp. MC140]MDN7132829.1 hypothetical protein [Halomonas sp. MC140]